MGFSHDSLPYYDRRGVPISLERFVELAGEPGYKRVAMTHLTEDIEVSTVWLGLDHGWLPGSPPLIFETMVFVALDEPIRGLGGHLFFSDGTECYRWSTEIEAIEGHIQVVRDLAGALMIDELPATEVHRTDTT